jgi:hypothetical protein
VEYLGEQDKRKVLCTLSYQILLCQPNPAKSYQIAPGCLGKLGTGCTVLGLPQLKMREYDISKSIRGQNFYV